MYERYAAYMAIKIVQDAFPKFIFVAQNTTNAHTDVTTAGKKSIWEEWIG